MRIISIRAGFEVTTSFGATSTDEGEGPKAGFPRDMEGQLLLHGYNSTAAQAEESYGVIERAIPDVDFAAGLLWPGGNLVVDYPFAVVRANESGWRLADILNGMKGPIDVQTHSLGARVILEALKRGAIRIRHLLLTAPAVNDDCFELGREYQQAWRYCKTVNVFYSRNDPVLRDSYPLGSFGHPAMGWKGPLTQASNISSFDYSDKVYSHGGYRFCVDYFAQWRQIINA